CCPHPCSVPQSHCSSPTLLSIPFTLPPVLYLHAPDGHRKKMAPASVTFSVARARAEVVVSSGLDAAERDEEKATADLARGMKD
ncbi:unnamed protein product, partial [Urochloa humidicola]